MPLLVIMMETFDKDLLYANTTEVLEFHCVSSQQPREAAAASPPFADVETEAQRV